MRYISFEGIDGSGKTTITKMFAAYLKSKNHSVLYTKEPYTEQINQLIRQPQPDKSLLFLFLADRAMHIEYLKKQNVDFIISDRSFYSTIAYQGYGAGMDIDFITRLNDFIVGDFVPDVVFYLDCDVSVALDRINKSDAIENKTLEFFNRVRQGYLELAHKYGFITIDTTYNNLENVFLDVIGYYERKFN